MMSLRLFRYDFSFSKSSTSSSVDIFDIWFKYSAPTTFELIILFTEFVFVNLFMIFVLQLIVAIMTINIKIKQINNIFLNTMALKNSNTPIPPKHIINILVY